MRRRTAGCVVVLALAAVVAGPASAPARSSTEARADAALERALRVVVGRPQGPPGVSALIQRDGARRFHTAGVARRPGRRRFRIDDHIRIASTTKAFEGAVVLRLVEAGRLSLDDTIAQHLAGLPATWGPITMGQLLQHRSGLPNTRPAGG